MYFTATFLASACLTLANGALLSSRSLSGEATFYGGNLAGGACSFSTYTLPSGILGTALSDSNWADSGNCGACVAVTGPSGNTLTAMIVDECPGCGTNHLDLFPDAFAKLADPSKGVIDVTWDYVNCPITSALQLHNKEGVSAYWFSMQVVNANKAVEKLEVSTDGGSTWVATARQTYNFFENSLGFGTTTVDVKVTSIDGDVVIVNSVQVSSGSSVTASGNFALGSSEAAASSGASSAPSVVSSSSVAAVVAAAQVSTSIPVAASSSSASSTTATATTSFPGADFQETSASSTTVPTTDIVPSSFTQAPAASSQSSSFTTTTLVNTTTITKTKTKCPTTPPTSLSSSQSTIIAAGAVTTTTSLPSSFTTVKPSYTTTQLGNTTYSAASVPSSTPSTFSSAAAPLTLNFYILPATAVLGFLTFLL